MDIQEQSVRDQEIGVNGYKRRPLMSESTRTILTTLFALALWAGLAPVARAQEVLPFPPTPSASSAGRTMQESVYKQRVEPRRVPADAPNILIVLIDDVGPGQAALRPARAQGFTGHHREGP